MDKTIAIDTYKKIKVRNKNLFNESAHCSMALETMGVTGRVSSFCKAAAVPLTTYYYWRSQYRLFKECTDLALIYARELWELEYEENKDDESWKYKEWQERGNRTFQIHLAPKQVLVLDDKANPWEHYQQIIKQASEGCFTATEIKLLMESLNVGTRVFEAFQLQLEVDKMKEELTVMDQRNVQNIRPITQTA